MQRTASAVESQAAAVDDGDFAAVALGLARKKKLCWRWSFVRRNRARIRMARLQWGKKRVAAVEEFVVAEQDTVVVAAVAVFAIGVHATTGEVVMMEQAAVGCCRSQHLHLQQTRESQSPGLKLGHRTRSWRRRKVWVEAGTCL